MRILSTLLFFALPFSAAAQVLPAPEAVPAPQIAPALPDGDASENDTQDGAVIENSEGEVEDLAVEALEREAVVGEDVVPESLEPDYSKLTPKAERAVRLDGLFVTLGEREEEEGAKLVAEEIMAIWMESGSASVNLLLRRGSEASARGNPKLARKMYNYAVDLSPDYAETWARSARLAFAQKDFNRALNESLKTLTLEPRHVYTLWTLGNVFESLDRSEEALEAYREANRLYPALKVVKDRLEALEGEVEGTVL